jgi:hypothetical protein
MSFAWPAALIGLVLVPALGILVWAADRLRRRDAARFGTPALVAGSVPRRPGRRRYAPLAVALAALAVLLVSRQAARRPVCRASGRDGDARARHLAPMAATDVKLTPLRRGGRRLTPSRHRAVQLLVGSSHRRVRRW